MQIKRHSAGVGAGLPPEQWLAASGQAFPQNPLGCQLAQVVVEERQELLGGM
jgi:hypothetical protein